MNIFYIRLFLNEEINEKEIDQTRILELLKKSNYEIIDVNSNVVSADYSKENCDYVFECVISFKELIEARKVLNSLEKKNFDIVFLNEVDEDEMLYMIQDDEFCLAETFEENLYTFNRLDGDIIEQEDFDCLYEMLFTLLYNKYTVKSDNCFEFKPSFSVSSDRETIYIRVEVLIKESPMKRELKQKN